jgi:hypothetical protein
VQIKPSIAQKNLNIWVLGGRMPPPKLKNPSKSVESPRKGAGLSSFFRPKAAFLAECDQAREPVRRGFSPMARASPVHKISRRASPARQN